MKLKGVNPVEQHIEKIVLVTVSGIFLLVVAAQFLYEPNKVKPSPTAQAVPPGKAFIAAEEKAKLLHGRMVSTDVRDLPEPTLVDLAAEFRKVRAGPVAPATPAVAFGPAVKVHGSDVVAAERGDAVIATLAVPAPVRVVAAAFRSTIDPTEPVNYPELKKLLPAEQPMDKASVSVAAHFDGTALRDALAADPDGDGAIRPIPATWVRDGVELVAVRLERQELRADGSWSAPVEVAPIPGRFDGVDLSKSVQQTADMNMIVGEARILAEEVQRPPYYHTIAGPEWAAPDKASAAEENKNPEVERLLRQRRNEASRLATVQRQLDIEKAKTPAPPRGGGGGGGGGKSGAPPAPSVNQGPRENVRLINLETQYSRIADAIIKIDDSLKALGLDPSGKPIPANAPAGQPTQPPPAKPLLESTDVELWAHDLTVEPGKSYRYRVKVAVNNPAFARTASLVAEQQSLAKAPLVYSAPSEWSDPVQVLADQYYFVVTASEDSGFGPPRASVEVYQYFYGHFRRGAVTLEPGDMIFAGNFKLPDRNLLPIYDLNAAKAAGGAPGITAPGIPAPVIPGRGRDQEGGGKGGGAIAEGPGAQPGAGAEQAKIALPENAKPWAGELKAMIEAYLLDVTRIPGAGEGGGSAKSQAILRDESGQIVIRVPEAEKAMEVYREVALSAKEGENQGQPAALAEPTPIRPPVGPRPEGPRGPAVAPPPGGGGGGGG